MPVKKEPSRTGRTKCYIHEMQRPLELPYKRGQYHICWICQSRLLELANANYQFRLRGQLVAISITPEVHEEKAGQEQGYVAKRTHEIEKETE